MVGTRMFLPASASWPCRPAPHRYTSHFPPRCQSCKHTHTHTPRELLPSESEESKPFITANLGFNLNYLWSGGGPGHDLFIHTRRPFTVILEEQTPLLSAAEGVDYVINYCSNSESSSSLPHQEQSHLVFGHRLQVGNSERLGEGGASSEGLRRLDRCREAVQPGPLAGTPDGGARLWRAVSEVRRHRGATQEQVQVETHSQGGEALHVGAVDELLATHNVGLQVEKKRRHHQREYNQPQELRSCSLVNRQPVLPLWIYSLRLNICEKYTKKFSK